MCCGGPRQIAAEMGTYALGFGLEVAVPLQVLRTGLSPASDFRVGERCSAPAHRNQDVEDALSTALAVGTAPPDAAAVPASRISTRPAGIAA